MRKLTASFLGLMLLASTAHAAVGRWEGDGAVWMDNSTTAPVLNASFADADDDATAGVDMTGATELGVPADGCDEDVTIGGTAYVINVEGTTDTVVDVCENGFVKTDNDNGDSRLFANRALPDFRFGENDFILPFFDDLVQLTDSVISILVDYSCGVGGALTCTTIEWKDMYFQSNIDSKITFQLTFVRGGLATEVRFHYLALTGTGANARSATIGMQSRNMYTLTYSYNSNSIAAGRVVSISADNDRDGLPDSAEDFDQDGVNDATEPNPAVRDSDGDNITDGGELANATDPRSAGDPAVADTDGDMDNLYSVDEEFFGTSDTDSDSDGDGLSDYDTNVAPQTDNEDSWGTRPDLADTDGDGVNDDEEANTTMNPNLSSSDPTDPGDTASVYISESSSSQYHVAHARDDDGNFHILKTDDWGSSIYYTMTDSEGTILIDETDIADEFALSRTTGFDEMKRLVIATTPSGDLLFMIPANTNEDDCENLLFGRIDPSADDQDGSSATPSAIVQVAVSLPDGGHGACDGETAGGESADNHADMVVDSAGNAHISFISNEEGGGFSANNSPAGGLLLKYYRVDGSNGQVLDNVSVPLMLRHPRGRTRIAVTGTTAHIFFMLPDQSRSLAYVQIAGGRVSMGPTVAAPFGIEWASPEVVGGTVYVLATGSGGSSSSSNGNGFWAPGVYFGRMAGGRLTDIRMIDDRGWAGTVGGSLVKTSTGRLLARWGDDGGFGRNIWALLTTSGDLIGARFADNDDDADSNSGIGKGWTRSLSEFDGIAAFVYNDGGSHVIRQSSLSAFGASVFTTPSIANLTPTAGVASDSGCVLSNQESSGISLGILLAAIALMGLVERRRRKA